MPGGDHVVDAAERLFRQRRRVHEPALRDARGLEIARGLAEHDAQPRGRHRPRVVRDARADLQQRRVAAAQALERAEHREHRVLLGAQHRLHRRREAQRRREPEILLDAAGHREPEMRVAVDEPGEHRLAAPVHALGARIAAIDLLGRADGGDAVGIHDDRGVVVHGAGGVGRDDGGVADDDRHGHPPARSRAFPSRAPTRCPRRHAPASAQAGHSPARVPGDTLSAVVTKNCDPAARRLDRREIPIENGHPRRRRRRLPRRRPPAPPRRQPRLRGRPRRVRRARAYAGPVGPARSTRRASWSSPASSTCTATPPPRPAAACSPMPAGATSSTPAS